MWWHSASCIIKNYVNKGTALPKGNPWVDMLQPLLMLFSPSYKSISENTSLLDRLFYYTRCTRWSNLPDTWVQITKSEIFEHLGTFLPFQMPAVDIRATALWLDLQYLDMHTFDCRVSITLTRLTFWSKTSGLNCQPTIQYFCAILLLENKTGSKELILFLSMWITEGFTQYYLYSRLPLQLQK